MLSHTGEFQCCTTKEQSALPRALRCCRERSSQENQWAKKNSKDQNANTLTSSLSTEFERWKYLITAKTQKLKTSQRTLEQLASVGNCLDNTWTLCRINIKVETDVSLVAVFLQEKIMYFPVN